MRNTLLFVSSLMAILLFLLATASSNTTVFSSYYGWLVILNSLLAAGLAGLVGVQLVRLRSKLKARVFGSRLAWRLTLMFGLVAVLPGALVYTLSVQFLTKSIETWFDDRVDVALERGFKLGQSAIDYSLEDLRKKADYMAGELGGPFDATALTKFTRLREQANVMEASLFDSHGQIIAHIGDSSSNPIPLVPDRAMLKQVGQKPYAAREPMPGSASGLLLRVVIPVIPSSLNEETRVLQLIQPVPRQLTDDAELVVQVRNDYKQLSQGRIGLKRIYGLTLTLALLLALLAALVLGIYLSEKLSEPLNVLAAGTRAVAQGDFSQMQPVVSRDELGILTHSFNRMTRQLSDAREAVEKNQREQAAAKAYLETVLGSLTAGVLTFDDRWRLKSSNASAGAILHADLNTVGNLRLADWSDYHPHLASFAEGVAAGFSSRQGDWQQQLECRLEGGARILLVRGDRLPASDLAEKTGGYVVVFDDVTELMQAQRDAAWGEVAKRLAHEIRNPLTPIQLAAERLEHKLAAKLAPADAEMLGRSTQTIVGQVAALKQMVDAFREYARKPTAKLVRLDLAALVREVLVLYEGNDVRFGAPDAPVEVNGDPTLLRQVIHNLLKNAREAVSDRPDGLIEVRLELNEHNARLSVADNGEGFADAILDRVFEPYATTKKKGTGLGLAIVKKIVEEHSGNILAANREPQGALVRIDIPLAENIRGE